MWLADSRSRCYQTYHFLSKYDLKDVVAFPYEASFDVVEKPGTSSGKSAEQDAGGTSGTDEDNASSEE